MYRYKHCSIWQSKLRIMVNHMHNLANTLFLLTIDQIVKDDVKKMVLTTMKAHTASVEIQTLSCNVLGNTAMIGMQIHTMQLRTRCHEAIHNIYFSTASEGDILFTKEFISPVCLAMRVSKQMACVYHEKASHNIRTSLMLVLLSYNVQAVHF